MLLVVVVRDRLVVRLGRVVDRRKDGCEGLKRLGVRDDGVQGLRVEEGLRVVDGLRHVLGRRGDVDRLLRSGKVDWFGRLVGRRRQG